MVKRRGQELVGGSGVAAQSLRKWLEGRLLGRDVIWGGGGTRNESLFASGDAPPVRVRHPADVYKRPSNVGRIIVKAAMGSSAEVMSTKRTTRVNRKGQVREVSPHGTIRFRKMATNKSHSWN